MIDTTLTESQESPASEQTFGEVLEVFNEYLTKGQHPEYRRFELSLGPGHTRVWSVWDFIYDAVHGTGGFADGRYLFESEGEIDPSGQTTRPFADRRRQADYDAFASHVCNASWDMIVSAKALIRRETSDPRLEDYWSNCDGQGTHITDALEYAWRQARMYGTGWILVDRSSDPLVTAADDNRPDNRPYQYSVPTRNVVHWEFDDDGLSALVIIEPDEVDITTDSSDPLRMSSGVCPIRVWTRDYWALFVPIRKEGGLKATNFAVADSGVNGVGEVPAVMLWNDAPDPGRAMGKSEMLSVARLARSVYQIDSERREHEKKANTQLAIPAKSGASGAEYESKQFTLGNYNAFVYDSESGKPEWVSADLSIIDKLKASRQDKVMQAYDMACLKAIIGTIQATSGFHASVELYKTEQRIAKHANALETAEQRIASLVLKYYGVDVINSSDLFTIVYPAKFGIDDSDKVLEQTATILELGLGDRANTKALYTLFKALYPRETDKEINAMVAEGVAKLKASADAAASASAQQDAKARVAGLVAKNTNKALSDGMK